jgi:hypothetical protein
VSSSSTIHSAAIILSGVTTPHAPADPPRKTSWKRWIIATAGVVAVITIALLAIPPKPEPVRVWFVGTTNDAGVKKLVFAGTNGLATKAEIHAYSYTDEPNNRKLIDGLNPRDEDGYAIPRAGETFTFLLKAAPNGVPYRVRWEFHERRDKMTRWGEVREGVYGILRAHGMTALARPFAPGTRGPDIPSTEIKE